MKKKIQKEPEYIKIYKRLRNLITDGSYLFGEKLPSKRMLAADTGTSVVTVAHAYEILCDEGYIEPRQRSGYFVCYKEADSFYASVHSAEDEEPLEHENYTHDSESFPFSVFARAARSVLSDYGEQVLVKTPGRGCAELRAAISAYLSRSRGIHVDPERIIIGSGAEYLYSIIVQMLGRNKIFAVENPSYDKIQMVYEANGAVCEPLLLGKNGIRSSELKRSKSDVLHITPYRSFPSGVTATASKKKEYLNWVKEGDRYLIEDDFESEFSVSSKMEDTIFSLDDTGRVIYINTFSRSISPAIRIGYIVLPKQLLPSFEEKADFYSCTVPAYEQYILATLLKSGDFERHVNRVRRKKRKERAESETS